jgi:hypothetical protein
LLNGGAMSGRAMAVARPSKMAEKLVPGPIAMGDQ